MSESKKRVRSGHKIHLKKMLDKGEGLMSGEFSEEVEVELISHALQLEKKRVILSKLDESILETVEDVEVMVVEIEEAEKIQESIETMKLRIERYVKKKIKVDQSNERDVACSGNESQRKKVTVGLPRIEIGMFYGDPKEYQTFVECFDATMDLYEVPDVTKFTYLKRYLGGEAANVVKLRAMYDVIEANLRSLENIRMEKEKYQISYHEK